MSNLDQGKVLGNVAEVKFTSLGGRSVEGKVDTGATISSLHADNIRVNQQNNSVSFTCRELSNSVITMQLDGAVEVVSADAGGNTRPIVKFDVEIDGVVLQSTSFNLNDRSEMDTPVLIGQNILKSGGFVIDVNKDSAPERVEQVQSESTVLSNVIRESKIVQSLQVLVDSNVTLDELLTYFKRS